VRDVPRQPAKKVREQDLAESREITKLHKLDSVLEKCIEMIRRGQESNPEKYGRVAACLIDNKNNHTYAINLPGPDGTRRHAEHVAIDTHLERYGRIGPNAIMVTTLSPCVHHTDERDGESCTDLLSDYGIEKCYAGWQDPTQHPAVDYPFNLQITNNTDIFNTCRDIAASFLPQAMAEDSFDGIDITMEVEDDEVMVRATAGGRELGHVLFVEEHGHLMPQDLEVDERYRGQGIAAAMYDYVKSKGYKIRRSGQQTDAGAGFWHKHRPEQNVWEQDVEEAYTGPPMKFLKPGELSGSYTPQQMQAMGFKQSVNGSWYIPMNMWQRLVSGGQIREGAPAVNNVVVPPPATSNPLTGRAPAGPDQITHAYRNMSPAELQHAIETGHFQANPNPGRTPGWSPDKKFWSSGDEQGHFGRDWKNADDNVRVRVPIDRVPANTAVDASHAQVLDKTTGKWTAVMPRSSSAATRLSRLGGGDDVNTFGFGSPAIDQQYIEDLKKEIAKNPGDPYNKNFQDEIDRIQKNMATTQLMREQDVEENFADGRHPEDRGDSKRHHVPTKSSVSNLRKFAKSHSGRAAQLAHWMANMKSGRAKKKTNEAVIGNLHFPRLTVAVDDHAIDRTRTRGINPHRIDQSLKKLSDIADQLAQMEVNNTVWVYDVSNNLGLGLRRISSKDMLFKLKTVVGDRPYDGVTPIIEIS
jgi:pyrimidine deaminase RibD-like protein/GNAT superfamily N-acetyltransferase